jgi:hypothetical protein
MSVIGSSQSSAYAFLNGNRGRETIVYNPAPFYENIPDNSFVVMVEGDPIADFSRRHFNTYSQNILRREHRVIYIRSPSSNSWLENHGGIIQSEVQKKFVGNTKLFEEMREIEEIKNPQNLHEDLREDLHEDLREGIHEDIEYPQSKSLNGGRFKKRLSNRNTKKFAKKFANKKTFKI